MKSKNRRFPTATRSLVSLLAGTFLTIAPSFGETKSPSPDLLRFQNGDTLHGQFLGLKDTEIRWRHSEASETIKLKTSKLRRIAFNGGRSREVLRSLSFVQLEGGDRIPGTIMSLDAENLIMETEFAGTVTIPREFISQLSPNPHGGALHYLGPFSADEWTVVEPPAKEEDPPPSPQEEEKEDPAAAREAPENVEEGPWVFSGGAYYSNGQLPIAIDTQAPDKTRIRFSLAWRNRLNAAIAFHATMRQPELPGDDKKKDDKKKDDLVRIPKIALGEKGGTAGFAYTYGHSYVLTIYSNYAQIYRCGFDEDGKADMDRLSNASANLRLEDAGQAEFELRCDRETGMIILFANGRFVSQWEDRRGYVATGSHLAFAAQGVNSRLRVSDVVVTSWNGMMDSAQSMEAEDRDIILLTNGTDRFSGELSGLKDGMFRVKGSYAEMTVPQEDVQEIRLAREKRTQEDDEESSRQRVRLLLQPYGRLTLRPLEANAERMNAHHVAMGELKIHLGYTSLMEFSFSNSVLDLWDDDY
jgi:hypothetical protein